MKDHNFPFTLYYYGFLVYVDWILEVEKRVIWIVHILFSDFIEAFIRSLHIILQVVKLQWK